MSRSSTVREIAAAAAVAAALLCAVGPAVASAARQHPLARRADGSSGGCVTATSWDYMYLEQQWPATSCKNCTENTYFTMHGLWPTNNDGSYPCNCESTPFDPSAVASIRTSLDTYWPSFQEDDQSFWTHEWSKHGTCSAPLYTSQLEFFKGALGARAKYDLYQALASASITPSNSATYQASDIEAAVNKALGTTPIISCGYHNEISEMGLCLDKQLQPMACPSSQPQQCTGEVGYPSSYN